MLGPKQPYNPSIHINRGWKAGIFWAGWILLFLILSLFELGPPAQRLEPINFIDVAIIAGLSFGIYKNSRICSFLIFAYLLTDLIISKFVYELEGSPYIHLILLYFFCRAFSATIRFHRSQKTKYGLLKTVLGVIGTLIIVVLLVIMVYYEATSDGQGVFA